MSHAKACLTSAGRLRLAQLVVGKNWPLRRATERWNARLRREAVGRPLPV